MSTILALLIIFLGSVVNVHAQGPTIVNSLEDAVALSESTKMPVLIIFGADWCGYCDHLKKDISSGQFNKELDSYIVCYINIDNASDLKKEYLVKNLPDSRVLRNKKEIDKNLGYEKNKYKKWINNVSKR